MHSPNHRRWSRPTISAITLALILSGSVVANATADKPWRTSTVAGNGSTQSRPKAKRALEITIAQPFGVEISANQDCYVTEVGNHRIWKIELQTGTATIVAGTGSKGYSGDGGQAIDAELNEPYELRIAKNGDLYFVEMQNHLIRKIDGKTKIISTVAGTGQAGFGGDDGPALKAMLNRPHSLVLDEKRFCIYVADIGNHRIRQIDLKTGIISTLAGNEKKRLPVDGQLATGNPILGPRALALKHDTLWVALREGHSLWSLDLETMRLSHAAGVGKPGFELDSVPAKEAHFNGPKGIALTPTGNVAIVDTENQAIRLYDPKTQIVSTIGGTGPAGKGFRDALADETMSLWARPHGIAADSDGNLYVGDTLNHRVRRLQQ